MDKEKMEALENLKKEYSKLEEKYGLPKFDELNEDFNIERISDIATDMILREVRKFMAETFSNYLRFIETILNPVSAPMFIFSVIKSINTEEKEKLKEIYKKLAKINVKILENELIYSTEKEVDFIKNFYKEWQEIKKELLEVIKLVEENWDKKFDVDERSYFG